MRPHLAQLLDLSPHPEGGWYRQTWRSSVPVTPDGYDGERATATAIYFLLNPDERSRWHRVASDELWLWHTGGPLTLTLGGTGPAPGVPVDLVLGADVAAGEQPQIVVPAGTWQSAAPASTDAVLVSCVVSPGFEFADFSLWP
jgi:predicted cupin superfamily sugar epimerase